MRQYILSIDQGTTSTRCLIFNRDGQVISSGQREHRQIYPSPGWVEHDPLEIWANTKEVIAAAMSQARINPENLAALGVTNQRESTLVWERSTGKPVCNLVVWQDTRTGGICEEMSREGGIDRFRPLTGLPLSTYFSAPKLRWILDNVRDARARAEAGVLLFGTVDSWLLWNLTGGVQGGLHLTDVTNAARTMLMNLHTLDWDDSLLKAFGIPRAMLPDIKPSAGFFGMANGVLQGVPIMAAIGDQQAALFGQACFQPGEVKNTYGTGCFILENTGAKPVTSTHGLLTTVAYKIGDSPSAYALEGSIAVAGALVQWLRDNLGLISDSGDIEILARSVEDNGGVYFVPAFSGLFAPYWRADARGIITGLTGFANKGHIARAALEATAYQTREVLDAMKRDSGVPVNMLKVDGGMVANDLLMQFQADIAGVPVIRARVAETTALGAAFAAGLGSGFWQGIDDIADLSRSDGSWQPRLDSAARDRLFEAWLAAVRRTFC